MTGIIRSLCLLAVLALTWPLAASAEEGKYNQDEVLKEAENFFGTSAEGLAKVVEKAFQDKGQPNGFIKGQEAAGAVGVGLRYGKGTLVLKNGETRKVYWQGPSIGFDVGGNASKVFTLVYRLDKADEIYQRFPGVDGSFYLVAGYGLNYQQSGTIVLAPIRSGAGLRAGASVGYLHYTRDESWIPF